MSGPGRSCSELAEEAQVGVLLTLRDHPWAAADHVAALSNLPLRSTQRYLSALVSQELIQTARVPCLRGPLYAPAPAGITQLAGGRQRARTYAHAFRLDCLHLAQALLRARSLQWAREFLAMLCAPLAGQSRAPLQWAVSPWEAHAGRATLRLDALGCALWMGRYVPFAVLADPGGLAVEGYAPLFERFHRWAEEEARRVGVQPVLVLLTTYARRARQLSVLWRDVAGREREPPQMFAAVFDDLGNPTAWLRGGTAQQGPLWSGCQGSATAIPRPWPSLSPGSTSRSVKVQELTAWLCEGESGPSASLRAGLRAAARAFLALSGKEWGALEQIARWPLLRPVDAALLGGYSDSGMGTVGEALQRLESLGLIEAVWESDAKRRALELQHKQVRGRMAKAKPDAMAGWERRLVQIEEELQTVPSEGGDKRYALAPLGLELLAAARGLPPLAYGRARLWPVGVEERDSERVVTLRTAHYLLAYEHTVLIAEFFLGLRRLAEEQWRDLNRNHQLLIWDSVECRRDFWDERGRQMLLPDAGGVYQVGPEMYEFWLEVDRGHSVGKGHGESLRRKYERYYLYRRRPDAIYGGTMPRLLIVTPSFGRALQVQQIILELARERGEPPLQAFLATLEDLWREPERLFDGSLVPREGENAGPGRPARRIMWPGLCAWRRADDFASLTWCFEGLGCAPPGTQRGWDVSPREMRAHTRRSSAQRKRRRAEREG